MVRSMLLTGVVAVLAGVVGCSSCDTCDDFPMACTGGNCGYGIAAPAGPAMMGPVGRALGSTMAAQPTSGSSQPSTPPSTNGNGNDAGESVSPPMAPPAGGSSPFDR